MAEPGLDADLTDKADLGEDSYRGTGRLTGRRALITGADSGIGAATAIAVTRAPRRSSRWTFERPGEGLVFAEVMNHHIILREDWERV